MHGLELAPCVVESRAICPEVAGACGLVATNGAHRELTLSPRSVVFAVQMAPLDLCDDLL